MDTTPPSEITAFLDRYAEALAAGDLPGIAACYALPALVVGDTGALPEGLLRGLHRVKMGRPRYPYAVALAEVARGKYEKDEFPPSTEIRPMYLREPDVTINWAKLRQEGPWAGA